MRPSHALIAVSSAALFAQLCCSYSGPSSTIRLSASPSSAHGGWNPLEEGGLSRERYKKIDDNPFLSALENPLSTFSIDVDTASYSNVRRFVRSGSLPPKDAVRIEEMVNYFDYDYPPPAGERPFSVEVELASAPWKPEHRLARVGLKGRELERAARPASSLVFLIDVSGSMAAPNKLSLLKRAFKVMLGNLNARDRVALVVYAGAAGLVLPSTSCDEKGNILRALDRLEAGGSTNGGAGIQLAYQVAADSYIAGGVNRVLLATDGDFNVGMSSDGGLVRLVEEQAKSGVFLTVLGFGGGNLNDAMMEQISNRGNGNYLYIDTLREAEKALGHELGATLITIAKDVKIQVEFNPARVAAYRLIGYENRLLAKKDFNDDSKDAGEIGAGHTVTALYEVVPVGAPHPARSADPLKYQNAPSLAPHADVAELLTVKLRYKAPEGNQSELMEVAVIDADRGIDDVSPDFKFACGVVAFGMLLRDSPYRGGASYELVHFLTEAGRGEDRWGYREEFIQLVEEAQRLDRSS